MGLDSYLEGEKFFWTNWKDPDADRQEDGLRVKSLRVELGYWRKHPNLHGYIVETFAKGVDDCKDIELEADDLRNIISAITDDRLPHTEGFFFGASDGSERDRDIIVFERALAWLEHDTADKPKLEERVELGGVGVAYKVHVPETMPRESRTVIYRASW